MAQSKTTTKKSPVKSAAAKPKKAASAPAKTAAKKAETKKAPAKAAAQAKPQPKKTAAAQVKAASKAAKPQAASKQASAAKAGKVQPQPKAVAKTKTAPKAAAPKAVPAKKAAEQKTAEAKPAQKKAAPAKAKTDLSSKSIDIKIRQLRTLAGEKGYLTTQDINKYLLETLKDPKIFDNVIKILEDLNIEIFDNEEEIENFKRRKEESDERQSKALQTDTLDDPVRMYLKQMGQVPLLSRDQEVAISKRIEKAEAEAVNELFSVSLTNKFQIDLAKKLLARDERFDKIVLDKKIQDGREKYFEDLPKYIEQAEKAEETLEKNWESARETTDPSQKKRRLTMFKTQESKLREIYEKGFKFKLKVFEEFLDSLNPDLLEIDDIF